MQTPSALTLGKGEKVLWFERRCWESLIPDFIPLVIFIIIWASIASMASMAPYSPGPPAFFAFLPCITVGFIIIIIWVVLILLKILVTEFALTNKRVHCKYGLIKRIATQAEFNNITDTALAQKFFGRILNYGTVLINTAGGMHFEIAFVGVRDPKKVIAKINNLRGVHAEKQKDISRIERIKDRYYTGEITKAQYEEAIKRIKEEIGEEPV